jgi:hypothetical protein
LERRCEREAEGRVSLRRRVEGSEKEKRDQGATEAARRREDELKERELRGPGGRVSLTHFKADGGQPDVLL